MNNLELRSLFSNASDEFRFFKQTNKNSSFLTATDGPTRVACARRHHWRTNMKEAVVCDKRVFHNTPILLFERLPGRKI